MGKSANRRATARNEQRKRQLQTQIKVSKIYHETKEFNKVIPIFSKSNKLSRYV